MPGDGGVAQAVQLERAELDLARPPAVALDRDGVDEQFVMAGIEDVRGQPDRHAVVDGLKAAAPGNRLQHDSTRTHAAELPQAPQTFNIFVRCSIAGRPPW